MSGFPALRFRQVHLDFHTSEHIPDVGADFDPEQFIDCLKRGRVNSITLFAMCHHGWCYYDTKIGKPHPNLKTNLLPRMLDACRKADVEAPVYITAGWNELMAREHADWVRLDKSGRRQYMPPEGKPSDPRPWGWNTLCFNTPYVDFICEISREVAERFNPVGIFYDITFDKPCWCAHCIDGMRDAGLNPECDKDAAQFAKSVYHAYLRRTTEAVWSVNPKIRIFHNGDHNRRGRDDLYPYYSHFEVESLPTGGWGYDHFPLNAKYFSSRGMDFLGMTGKFHLSWGEFGGFKNPEALKYECAQMISLGAKCSVGDQLHPSGRMDAETYRIIGEAYALVEEREKLCDNVEAVSDIGVVCGSAALGEAHREEGESGACNMLLQTQRQFDVIDAANTDFGRYRLLILPDEVPVSKALKKKLDKYLKDGGALLLSGESGLDKAGLSFNVDVGADFAGKSLWDIDYTVVGDAVSANMVRSPFLNYEAGYETIVRDAEPLAGTVSPYFSRTFKHFCSHGATPPSMKDAGYPSVIRKGRVIYIAHKIFTMYKQKGMKLHRDLVDNCIKLILPEPFLEVRMPSAGRAFLMRRKGRRGQLLLHLLYASPIKRGAEVVEDIVPLYDVKVRMRLGGAKLKSVELPLSGGRLDFKADGDLVEFSVPKVALHEIVRIGLG